ncbi:mechanosensitive ion channel family protein [Bacteroidales bacterium OttesenSCG-928-I21]|nr:mechanosensitive ion channel family protein [Bacteroidales bacterium OttesenSCG-928-I21]
MLAKEIYGNTLKEWLISISIILIAIIVCKLISLLNKYVIQKLTKKTTNRYDDILFSTLETPFLFGLMLLAIWISLIRLNFSADVRAIIAKSYQILTTLNITWFVSRFIGAIIDEQERKSVEKHQTYNKLLPLIKRGIVALIWILGMVMALNNAGVNIAALLGTLGIGGIAFALAAQDTLKNMIGGITLFSDRPFRIGDRIKFDAIDGYVEDIGMRSTRIRTLDKRIITIPNYKIVDAPIENISAETGRRVVAKLGVTYNTTPEKMDEAIKILKSIPQTVNSVSSKDLSVNFTDFGDSALIITFIYFVKKSSPDIIGTTSQVNMEILTKFNQSEIKFAFPSQTIYIENES